MKFTQTLLSIAILVFSTNLYSQDNFVPNDEDKVQFLGIENTNQNLFTPIVNWPIKSIKSDDLYESSFEIQNLNSSISKLESTLESVISAELKRIDQKSYLILKTTFPTSKGKMLSKAFYSLGVEEVLLQGEKVNIYRFYQVYKSVSHNEIRKTRVYLK